MDYSQVNLLDSWYKSVNFGVKTGRCCRCTTSCTGRRSSKRGGSSPFSGLSHTSFLHSLTHICFTCIYYTCIIHLSYIYHTYFVHLVYSIYAYYTSFIQYMHRQALVTAWWKQPLFRYLTPEECTPSTAPAPRRARAATPRERARWNQPLFRSCTAINHRPPTPLHSTPLSPPIPKPEPSPAGWRGRP
jgi:hypothetical protein